MTLQFACVFQWQNLQLYRVTIHLGRTLIVCKQPFVSVNEPPGVFGATWGVTGLQHLFAEQSPHTQEQDCMMCPPFLTPKFPAECVFLCYSVSVHEFYDLFHDSLSLVYDKTNSGKWSRIMGFCNSFVVHISRSYWNMSTPVRVSISSSSMASVTGVSLAHSTSRNSHFCKDNFNLEKKLPSFIVLCPLHCLHHHQLYPSDTSFRGLFSISSLHLCSCKCATSKFSKILPSSCALWSKEVMSPKKLDYSFNSPWKISIKDILKEFPTNFTNSHIMLCM